MRAVGEAVVEEAGKQGEEGGVGGEEGEVDENQNFNSTSTSSWSSTLSLGCCYDCYCYWPLLWAIAERGGGGSRAVEGGVGYVLLLLLLLCAFNVNVNVENMSMIYLLFAAACGRVAPASPPSFPAIAPSLDGVESGERNLLVLPLLLGSAVRSKFSLPIAGKRRELCKLLAAPCPASPSFPFPLLCSCHL